MEFGSKYVFSYSNHSDEEVVSDDEYEQGLSRSAPNSDEDECYAIAAPASRAAAGDVAACSDAEKSKPAKKKGGFLGALFGSKRRSVADEDEGTSADAGRTSAASGTSNKKAAKKVHHWQRKSAPGAPPPLPPKVSTANADRAWRRADTNVIAVKFDKLTAPGNMHTGDSIVCTSCSAILSHISKVTELPSGTKVWKCEFCCHANEVDIMPEEQPKQNDVTFMLMPSMSTTASGVKATDQSLVVFCMDTSGSMCLTSEVPGHVRFRGDQSNTLLSHYRESRHSQYLPHQRRDITFVSRLQAAAAAIDHQLGEMARSTPQRRACLVTFSTEVQLLGDCIQTPISVAGGKLHERDSLIAIGESFGAGSSVKESRERLSKKVFDLEEGGQTALGPALLLSVTIAKAVPGSKVIVCTDGMANIGLGSLDVGDDEAAYEQASAFYKDVGTMATEAGVSVSVVTIKGTDCKLVELGQVADLTGGHVNIVDPLKLKDEFGSVLEEAIIATKVSATLLLHKRLYFREENRKESRVDRQIGNVTRSTEVTFEYGVRSNTKKQKTEQPARADVPKHLDTLQEASLESMSMDVDKPACPAATATTGTTATTATAASTTDTTATATTATTDSTTATVAATTDTTATTTTTDTTTTAAATTDTTATSAATTDSPTTAAATTDTTATAAATTDTTATSAATATGRDNSEAGACAAAAAAPAPAGADNDDDEALTELPFQLQIRYVDMDGAQALRVITQTMPVTTQREDAEREMNTAIVAVHASQQSANMAMQGNVHNSRMHNMMYKRLLHRKVHEYGADEDEEEVYSAYSSNAAYMDTDLRNVGERSRSSAPRLETRAPRGGLFSVAPPSPPPAPSGASFSAAPPLPARLSARSVVTDEEASRLYQNSKMNTKWLQKK